ncbi:hypothetical protein DFH07DRAFT_774804 [Mycena maculata]|uniref:Uncharacterized protein n=1 Tax=Mycena maculata TaxID=230809 RepID=A0AAD7N8N6_9AGAR|nr:hypothetical protein DFH07DRAFT_774804 [Mycena maculata]
MTKRLEKQWAALDQDLFILCLVLNPYECVSHFGDQAKIPVFTLSSVLMELYHQVKVRPPPFPLTPELADTIMDEKIAAEAELFSGQILQLPQCAPCKVFTHEELLMELLATEESDEELDDGELEGSGDDDESDSTAGHLKWCRKIDLKPLIYCP